MTSNASTASPLFAQPGDTIGAGFKAATRPQETAATRQPGMGGDGRCMTCDSRQCGVDCGAQPGYVYAPGMGWVSPETATALEAVGRTVYWDDRAERFLP